MMSVQTSVETAPASPAPKKSRKSTVRHTRAIARARSKRPLVTPPAEQIEQHLAKLITPAIYAQVAAYSQRGMRHRILTLQVMVAFVLSLIWRQMGSVSAAVRVLEREGMLWSPPLEVSAQAVSQRLRTFPAALFEAVFHDVLPQMHARWKQRNAQKRPLPPALAWATDRFSAVYAVDGSTLDALMRKVGLLREDEKAPLAGRMAALLDVGSRLPHTLWPKSL